MRTSEITSNSSDSDQLSDKFYSFEGEILEEYNIIKLIGRGSYSGVWLAFCISDLKYYAIKIQNPEDYNDGIEEIIELELNDEEKEWFEKGVQSVNDALSGVEI